MKDGVLAGALAREEQRYAGGNVSALNDIAWSLVDTPGLTDRPLDVALEIATSAVSQTKGTVGLHFESPATAVKTSANPWKTSSSSITRSFRPSSPSCAT